MRSLCWQFTLLIIQVCFLFLPFFFLSFTWDTVLIVPSFTIPMTLGPGWSLLAFQPQTPNNCSVLPCHSLPLFWFIFFFDGGIRSPCLPYHPPVSGRGVPSWKRQERNFWKLLWSLVVLSSITPWQDEERRNTHSHRDPLHWYQYITKEKKSLFKVDLSTGTAEGETNEEPPGWWTPCGCWNLKLSSLRLLLLWYPGISRRVDSVGCRPELWWWLSRGGQRTCWLP